MEEIIFKQQQEEQKRLFEKSQEEILKEDNSVKNPTSSDDQNAFEACIKAQNLAKRYIEETNKPELMNEIYNLFKIVLIPDEVLIQSFVTQGQESMASAYRKFAMMIHPDKNPHQCANFGFNKLVNAFNEAKS